MMYPFAVINVPTPGTPVRVTVSETDPAAKVACHGVMIQARKGNTGKVYIGRSDMDKSTEVGVIATLAIPTANTIPSFSAALTLSPNALNLAPLYIDADVANEGVKVSILVA